MNKDYQVAAKVRGFITNLECFSYAFFLNAVASIFEKIEILNTSLFLIIYQQSKKKSSKKFGS